MWPPTTDAFRSARIAVANGLSRLTALVSIIIGLMALVGLLAASLNLLPPAGWCLLIGAQCSVGEQAVIALVSFMISIGGLILTNQLTIAEQLISVRNAAAEDRAQVVITYERVYRAAVHAIQDAQASGSRREILVMDVSFRVDPRYPLRHPPQNPNWHRLFDAELVRKAREGWHIRRFWYVSTLEKLEQRVREIAHMQMDPKRGTYEAGIWVGHDAPPAVELLIAGERQLLLGLYSKNGGTDDYAAVLLQSRNAVIEAREHFYLLWDDPRCVRLMAGQQINQEVFNQMKTQVL